MTSPTVFRNRPRRSSARRAIAIATAAATLAGVAVQVAAGAGNVAAARTIHVAPWGDDGASGSAGAPLRTVGRAVSTAASGDAIELRGGVYRESVQIYRKALDIRSRPGERAVFEGAGAIDGFRASGGDWYVDGWTTQFYETRGAMVSSARPVAALPDQVFVDGTPQRQVTSRNAVAPGTFFHDTGADRIWIGSDPAGRRVEASDLSWGLYFNHADGSSLTNVTVRRYATEGRHMAAIRAYANNLTFTNVTSELNAYSGLSAMGTNISISDSRFVDNGYIGLHGHRVSSLVVERSAILGNNKAGFDSKHSAGGMKVTTSNRVVVRDSDASRNDGPGLWTDIGTTDVTFTRNLTESNGRSGIEIELSNGVNLFSNVAVNNGEAGLWILESQNVSAYHNAAYGNQREIWVLEGPRQNVQNVSLLNNVVGQGRGDQQALLNVDDWTEERSAAQMNVHSNHNAFWLPPSSATKNLARWARWGDPLAISNSIETHRAATGQDGASMVSTAASNPFVRNPAVGDYRMPDGMSIGMPIHGWPAEEMGMASGAALPIGPVAATPRR